MARVSSPAAKAKRLRHEAIEELHSLLQEVAKESDSVSIQNAKDVLIHAVEGYLASKPYSDRAGRRTMPGLRESRQALRRLLGSLEKIDRQLSNLPLKARTAVGEATNAPLGKITLPIREMLTAVPDALQSLESLPNKENDYHRAVLARQVGVVFEDILAMKPTSTRERQLTQNATGGRSGGAYARVLRATLKVAGITSYDSGPLIDAGLRLLKDKALPRSTTTSR